MTRRWARSASAASPSMPPRRRIARLRIDNWRPYVGIFGVLLGSIMGTLGSCTTSFGLADLRSGIHAGFAAF